MTALCLKIKILERENPVNDSNNDFCINLWIKLPIFHPIGSSMSRSRWKSILSEKE